jgi:hypothetical protein
VFPGFVIRDLSAVGITPLLPERRRRGYKYRGGAPFSMVFILPGLIAPVVMGPLRRYVVGRAVRAAALPLAAAAVVLAFLAVPIVLVALFARPVRRKGKRPARPIAGSGRSPA